MNRIRTYSTSLFLLTYFVICLCVIPQAKTAEAEGAVANFVPKKVDKKELDCLAKNVFFEARGTDEAEMIRVVNVTTNRVNESGKSYCRIVREAGQFSWTLDLIKN